MGLLDGKPALLFMCDRRKENVRWVVRGNEQQIAITVAVLLISLRPSSRKRRKAPVRAITCDVTGTVSTNTQGQRIGALHVIRNREIWEENFPLSDPDSATLFRNYKLSQSRSSQRSNFKKFHKNRTSTSSSPLFFWCPCFPLIKRGKKKTEGNKVKEVPFPPPFVFTLQQHACNSKILPKDSGGL
ncbi:hypothetical protein CDAR_242691 [Caerostris darwini]|uniref:Uncharacterized protein n=1 Tax=Caerostris darwini TaxID=1538125 RepID=A0AAV4MZT8_9ARAC|nr:hypothetical protein CDAR_242691 [Caerostris darwini]